MKSAAAGHAPSHTSGAKATPLSPAPALGARWLIGLFAVALLMRLAVVLALRHTVFAATVVGDGRYYDQWARQLSGGDWIGSAPNFLSPLFAYFLAVVYRIAGPEWMIVRLIQALFGAATCVLLADAGARLFDRRTGIACGVIAAFYAPVIWLEATIHKTGLEILLSASFIALIARLLERRTVMRLIGCGTVMGALALTRENSIALLPVTAFWLLVQFRGEGLAARLRWIGALMLGFVLVLAPFVLRNVAVFGEWTITYNFGMNFWIGNNLAADGLYQPLRPGHGRPELEAADTIDIASAALHRTLTPLEASGWWFDRACADIGADPARWLRLLARKWMLVWNAEEQMDADSFAAYADESRLLSMLGSVFRFGVLMPLAAAGLWLTRRDWRRLWLFHVAILALAASITLAFVLARFRISLAVFLIPFAGAGVASLGARWRESGGAERAWLVLVLVASAALANWPLHTDSGDARAGTYASYAVAFLEDGQPQQAMPLLRKAVALEPDNAELRNDLAIALRKTGDLDAAIVEFGNATRLRPDYPDAHLNFSTALSATPGTAPDYEGNMQAALAECREALRLQPEFPLAQSHLGFLLYKRGDLPGAISAWRVALQMNPTDVRSLANLAGALAQQGDVEGAIVEYQRVLELDPDDVAARKMLEKLRAAPKGQ